ncbi:hypothetical protein BSK20_03315 [SR1 bacterium human oral taxon HOT-345]|nr:hypothetical protein BSK20_03315 [SR1 bacterium human oral taxon HOT-345]
MTSSHGLQDERYGGRESFVVQSEHRLVSDGNLPCPSLSLNTHPLITQKENGCFDFRTESDILAGVRFFLFTCLSLLLSSKKEILGHPLSSKKAQGKSDFFSFA